MPVEYRRLFLYSERLLGFVGLVANDVLNLNGDGVRPRPDVPLQCDPHRSRDVSLGVKRFGLFGCWLRLHPQHFSGIGDDRSYVADINLVLWPVVESGDVETGPDAITRPVGQFLDRLRVVLGAEELEIPGNQGIAG